MGKKPTKKQRKGNTKEGSHTDSLHLEPQWMIVKKYQPLKNVAYNAKVLLSKI